MTKTFEEYIASGMDESTARYFASGRRRIVSAEAKPNRQVEMIFDNGETRVLDCREYFIAGSVFNKLSDDADFARVFIDEVGNLAWDVDPSVDSAIHWNNRIDFCRDACYLKSVPLT